MRASTLVMSEADHVRILDHLFPGDGKEAVAILLCTRVAAGRLKLLVRQVELVPHDACVRESDCLTWPAQVLDTYLDACSEGRQSLILIHSHPTGYPDFSRLDDESDASLMPYLYPYDRTGPGGDLFHGTAIMLPDGAVKARLYCGDMRAHPVDLVAIYGDDLRLCWNRMPSAPHPMAFRPAMREELARLSIAVIGLSGTGSIVAEQLLRLGVGEIVAIDDDVVEDKNLNRILNSTQADAREARLKVDVFKEAAARIRPSARVVAVPLQIGTPAAIDAAAEADIVFSCVDTVEGRHIADRLAATMLQPLFDVGVSIPVYRPNGELAISNVCGRVDYVQPGGSSLGDRLVYTPQKLAAEDLRRRDPQGYGRQVGEGYMPGTDEEAPSVITVNMRAASAVVQEFVARRYLYRQEPNASFARTRFDLATEEYESFAESTFQASQQGDAGRGLESPLLGLPHLEDLRCR